MTQHEKRNGLWGTLEEQGPGVPRTLRMHFLKEVEFVCNTDRMVTQRKKTNRSSVNQHLERDTQHIPSWLLS